MCSEHNEIVFPKSTVKVVSKRPLGAPAQHTLDLNTRRAEKMAKARRDLKKRVRTNGILGVRTRARLQRGFGKIGDLLAAAGAFHLAVFGLPC